VKVILCGPIPVALAVLAPVNVQLYDEPEPAFVAVKVTLEPVHILVDDALISAVG
jgi:hypothetical protein